MGSCIYCGAPSDSKEDWFPRWMGRIKGVGLLLDRICTACNNELGRTVDQSMSRQSPEATNRYALGICGRTGQEPASVYQYRLQGAQPPVVGTAVGRGYEMAPLMEDIPGSAPPRRRPLRQLVFRTAAGEWIKVGVRPNADGEWLAQAVQNRSLAGERLEHIFCEPEDEAVQEKDYVLPKWFRRAVVTACPWADAQAKTNPILVHWLTTNVDDRKDLRSELRIEIPREYPRALAKIAFHYLLMFDRHTTGHEPEFAGLREFIRRGGADPATYVDLNGRPFVVDAGWSLRGIHHFLFVYSDSAGDLVARLQFFVRGPYGAGPVLVRLGRDQYTRGVVGAHAIRLHAEPKDGFDGELLTATSQRLGTLWGLVPPPWAGPFT